MPSGATRQSRTPKHKEYTGCAPATFVPLQYPCAVFPTPCCAILITEFKKDPLLEKKHSLQSERILLYNFLRDENYAEDER